MGKPHLHNVSPPLDDVLLCQLALVVEQSPSSIVITDLAANIVYANRTFCDLSGYLREDLLGHNPRILSSGKTPRSIFEAMFACLQAGNVWKGEMINHRKNGEEYTEFAEISLLHDDAGHITHYLAIKEDITDRKRMGQELDRHRHHLQKLVEERTAKLTQTPQALEASRRAVEAANEAKSSFLANMSHEIRTPMNAVIALGQLMLQDIDDPKQRGRLLKMSAAAQHLLAIINDILDLSKIDAGQRVRFEVQDSGIGFGPETHERLFRAFEQGDDSTTRLHGGTGLGLAICRRVADLMHGRIGAESEPNKGSTFWFEADFQPAQVVMPITPVVDLNHCRVLIIGQDDRQIAELGNLVVKLGMRFYAWRNGREAATRIKTAVRAGMPYDLVLCHAPLAAIDKLFAGDALRRLREPRLGKIPPLILVASKDHDAEDAKNICAVQFDGIVSVPRTAAHLHDELLYVLAGGKIDHDAPKAPEQAPIDLAKNRSIAVPPAPTITAGDDLSDLEALAGLDVEAGLVSLLGRKLRYRQLLGRFIEEHSGDLGLMRANMASGNLPDARRIAHSLKGVAGILGAVEVQKWATAADARLKQGLVDPELDEIIGSLDNAMSALIKVLNPCCS